MVAFAERVGGFAREARNGTSMAVALARTNCSATAIWKHPSPSPPFSKPRVLWSLAKIYAGYADAAEM